MKASAFAARARVRPASAVTSRPAAAACSSALHRGRQRVPGRRPDRAVLGPDQVLGLRAPWQQLRVEQQPAGAELVEQAGGLGRGAEPGQQLLGEGGAEERAPRPVQIAPVAVARAEPLARDLLVPADQGDRTRAHVLLLAYDRVHAVGAVGVEGLVGVLEQAWPGRRRDRAHRRRQVQQPARVDGEPAHHLERGGRVLLPDRYSVRTVMSRPCADQ